MFEVETAQELLLSLRRKTEIAHPLGPVGIDDFDDHVHRGLPKLTTFASTLNRGDIIEIEGPHDVGKTHLLYFFVMTCVLPHAGALAYEGVSEAFELGGKGKAVVAIDCDGQWSTDRLNEIISNYVRKRIECTLAQRSIGISAELSSVIVSLAGDICRQSLKRLHIFRPNSSLQLAATLASIPNFHAVSLLDQEICMLMIDSLDAFHWPDLRRSGQIAHVSRRPHTGDELSLSQFTTDAPMKQMIDSIQVLRHTIGVVTFITSSLSLPFSKDALNCPAGERHASPFSITHHINLISDSSPLDDRVADSEQYHKVEAHVCTPVSLDDAENQTPRAPRRAGKVIFGFRIGEEGLLWS